VDLLREVGIFGPEETVNRYPHELSGGMRQRAVIAMALACNPALLIADEPTTALDTTVQAQVLDLLRTLQRVHNSAVVLITHDVGVVAEMADKVVVMYAGRVVESGTAAQVFNDPWHPYTWGLLGSIPPLTGARPRRLVSIPGAPPMIGKLPPGCAFAPRCPVRQAECSSPPPRQSADGHAAICVLDATQRAALHAPGVYA
jgi:peptide/nickel transport system ATP-binding protein